MSLNRFIAAISPGWALRRAQARNILAYYEAASPSQYRQANRAKGSANSDIRKAGRSLREQARHLEQNHDLARGVLSVLVRNVIGPNGIGIEPQPRTRSGEIHEDFARQIQTVWRDWSKRPEVTWRHNWPAAQRLLARSWFRDGEVLAQLLTGTVAKLDHGTRIPLSLELLEADFLPIEYSDPAKSISSGVQKNAWGRPTHFHIYKDHPGERGAFHTETKAVSANRMLHLAMVDRLHQDRGVSVFASVLSRLEDIKDIEESERVAAKVAASMAAFIKKGTPDMLHLEKPGDSQAQPRDMRFRPGMVFDDLLPGEDIGTIDTRRPNPALDPFRRSQQRAVASGTETTYSSTSKDYDGSYSAQRQELVEGYAAYGILSSEFTGKFVQPVYEAAISAAILSGQLTLPPDIDPDTLDAALYIPPQMPWIDPAKEAAANLALEQAGHASGPEIIRRRGLNPSDVIDQEKRWRKQWRDAGEQITADPANDTGNQNEPDKENPSDD
jgi:lambda family phage portal protein